MFQGGWIFETIINNILLANIRDRSIISCEKHTFSVTSLRKGGSSKSSVNKDFIHVLRAHTAHGHKLPVPCMSHPCMAIDRCYLRPSWRTSRGVVYNSITIISCFLMFSCPIVNNKRDQRATRARLLPRAS